MTTLLRELSVQNLALIEDARVELQHGYCAWTGETGAGKTLLLTALGLLLGERGSSELIRTGADELRITGRFELPRPDKAPLKLCGKVAHIDFQPMSNRFEYGVHFLGLRAGAFAFCVVH